MVQAAGGGPSCCTSTLGPIAKAQTKIQIHLCPFFVGCFKPAWSPRPLRPTPPPPPQPPRLSALLPYVYDVLLRVVSWIPGTNTAALSGWGQRACRPPKPWPPPRQRYSTSKDSPPMRSGRGGVPFSGGRRSRLGGVSNPASAGLFSRGGVPKCEPRPTPMVNFEGLVPEVKRGSYS